ncbi:hypothetical protein COCSUDRAFT_34359 [Coccomyxa subellipsoidea C-169]|uniref:Uncharacterized protein n=1 Tax=Coccomyxa subellipsoidea (strain C-169) TaxID=574566 RepID=I0YL47_COCSC|nr:hypothetical protein COCSUDRAFT_34359 [Coccomyxa subellipsoidea C-169]EIE19116.1 hypothetical protein COCSUDRAFT_34359 [Coccomyxa subellipsoidea C-169]|eukprot:XP_005643660.1 hypothetical protein COCSUDRAFT_34359 [Coccomyxa subellipsoidea C-169]
MVFELVWACDAPIVWLCKMGSNLAFYSCIAQIYRYASIFDTSASPLWEKFG